MHKIKREVLDNVTRYQFDLENSSGKSALSRTFRCVPNNTEYVRIIEETDDSRFFHGQVLHSKMEESVIGLAKRLSVEYFCEMLGVKNERRK